MVPVTTVTDMIDRRQPRIFDSRVTLAGATSAVTQDNSPYLMRILIQVGDIFKVAAGVTNNDGDRDIFRADHRRWL